MAEKRRIIGEGDYFPKEIRKEFKLGEYWEEPKKKRTTQTKQTSTKKRSK